MKNKWRITGLGLLLVSGLSVGMLTIFTLTGLQLRLNRALNQTLNPAVVQALSAQAAPVQQRQAQTGAAQIAGAYRGTVDLQVTVAGLYSDTLPTTTITDTPDLGRIDLALQISQTGNVLTGYVDLDKTLVFSVEHTIQSEGKTRQIGPYVNGSSDGTTVTLLSERVTTTLNGRSIQRQFWITGTIRQSDGSQLTGEYRETLWGAAREPVTVVGTFTLQRAVFGNNAPDTSNQLPQPVTDEVMAEKGKAVTINVLSNDSDPNGDALTIVSVSKPQFGTATTDGQKITYTPNAGFEGTDTFTYLVTDGKGGESAGAVTITVGTNQAPTAGADSATTAKGTPVTIDVGANDRDLDGDALTITIETQPRNGTATVADGKIVYTPNADFVGTDSFTYIASDGKGGIATATVTVTVSATAEPSTNAIYLPVIQR